MSDDRNSIPRISDCADGSLVVVSVGGEVIWRSRSLDPGRLVVNSSGWHRTLPGSTRNKWKLEMDSHDGDLKLTDENGTVHWSAKRDLHKDM